MIPYLFSLITALWGDKPHTTQPMMKGCNSVFFTYLCISWLIFGLFPLFGCYESCCHQHLCASLCGDMCFQFFGYRPCSWNTESYANCLRNHENIVQSGYSIFHSHEQCMRVPVSPHPGQHLLLSVFLNDSHTSGGEVVCSHGLIPLSSGEWHTASSHVILGHVFLGKRLIQVFSPF